MAPKKILYLFFRVIIPVIFFSYAFSVIQYRDIVTAFRGAEWGWFTSGCFCVIILNYLCSSRTKKLLQRQEYSIHKLWTIHALSALIAGVLPFRTGELSFVYYLNKSCSVPVDEGAALLLSVRLIEFLFFVSLLFTLALIGCILDPNVLSITMLTVIAINLLISISAVWNADLLVRMGSSIVSRFLNIILSKSSNIMDRLSQKLYSFFSHTRSTVKYNLSGNIISLTMAIVILRQLFILCMLKSMGVTITIKLVVLLFVFLFAVKFIQSIGSFGSQEAGIAGPLILIGMTQEEALPIAIGTHLLQWFPIILFGTIGYVTLKFFHPPLDS